MTVNTLSPRQITFVMDMLREVAGENADYIYTRNEAAGLFATRESARVAVDKLIVKRDAVRAERRAAGKPVTGAATVTVAAGYYAVEWSGALRFYRVVEGSGKWAGRVFVNRFRSDDLGRVFRSESDAVLALIAADVEAARMRFARETVHCYQCGKRLTDEVSRELGIGPVCRNR
jgi:Family of unknown function (DUF6011)